MDRGSHIKSERLAHIAMGGPDRDYDALSLLRATPFQISDGAQFRFPAPAQAAKLLCGAVPNLPQSLTTWTSRMQAEDVRARSQALRRLTWDGAQYALTYPWRTEQGEDIMLEERGQRRAGSGDIATDIHGVISDVTMRQRHANRAAYLANHDGLTDIANHDALLRAAQHMTALSTRQRSPSAFLRLRVTNVADINEIYGFETGDRLIAEIARRLSQAVRAPDVLGRIKSADFGLCLYGIDRDEVVSLGDRLKFLIENAPVPTPHGGLYPEIAMAATMTPDLAQTAEDALAQTAIAIPTAQGQSVAFYTPSMGLSATPSRRDISADDILDALNQRRIRLAYQPIIDTKTRQLHHYECLLRLRRADGEIVSAGRFIMAAERLGLVHLLDRRALEIAGQALLDNPDIHLALNVSAGTVTDARAAGDYLKAMSALGPHAQRITIELTETVAVDDPAKASDFSNEARTMGCGFAIDDFGSGYTTFRNLMAIEADMIKIDGTLIEGIATDPNKQTFVRMMVDLAQTFSVKTVAEMVDSAADAEVLRRLNVDYLQGFMFGVPSAAPAWQRRAG